jgi:hypothetical protein
MSTEFSLLSLCQEEELEVGCVIPLPLPYPEAMGLLLYGLPLTPTLFVPLVLHSHAFPLPIREITLPTASVQSRQVHMYIE